ncbi:MAG: energy-coupling factor transporter transmembrane protein EcfT [Oscillospiraceae bacterium]|jgi:energy-coupling factor transport system permease protein|nr:energy-coupling factor transporter transmembrane protein EcfT [Oscillospiraceae bacterium]
MNTLTIGVFVPGDSIIHRLDPRTKLILTVAYVALVFMAKQVIGVALAVSYVGAALWMSKINPRIVLRGLRSLTVLVVMTAVLNLFLTQTGTTLVQFWKLRITDDGIYLAVYFALRLMFLVSGTTMLTLTTSPIALTDALESLMRPLKRFRFPAHEIAMMMSIALRFIPTLMEETDKIMKAQASRGADFETGSVWKRAKALAPLLAPLFISAFRRAADLALAMESRCYQGGEGRTRMRVLMYGAIDFAAFGIMAAMLILSGIEAILL